MLKQYLDKFLDTGKLQISLRRARNFSPDEAKRFRFFQFNSGNAEYFLGNSGNLRVTLADTPHYAVAAQWGQAEESKTRNAKSEYLEYLTFSWPAHGLSTHREDLEEKYAKYLDYIGKTARAGKIDRPVILTEIEGIPGLFIVDGNHRCAIAAALGLTVPAKVIEFPLAFDQFMTVNEFYGTGNMNMPYQSIYVDKKIVRQGRRDDIYDRLGMLPPDFLRDKSVLDVGCNLGMNSVAAYKLGAKSALGLEMSKQISNFATRLAILNEAYPDVQFRQFNVDQDSLPTEEKFDVAFMLSVHDHLKKPDRLAKIARDNVTEAVVFEGHPHTELSDYNDFFEKAQLTRIEKVADLGTSIFDRSPTRQLWICRF